MVGWYYQCCQDILQLFSCPLLAKARDASHHVESKVVCQIVRILGRGPVRGAPLSALPGTASGAVFNRRHTVPGSARQQALYTGLTPPGCFRTQSAVAERPHLQDETFRCRPPGLGRTSALRCSLKSIVQMRSMYMKAIFQFVALHQLDQMIDYRAIFLNQPIYLRIFCP